MILLFQIKMWCLGILLLVVVALSRAQLTEKRSRKTVIVQYFNCTLPQLLAADEIISLVNGFNYASAHGYDYKIINVNREYFQSKLNLHDSWVKVFAIRSLLLRGYEYVVYIDKDYYFGDMKENLRDQLKLWYQMADLYMLYDPSNTFNVNTGFQVWKNTEKNLESLETWIDSIKSAENGELLANEFPYEHALLPQLQKYFRRHRVVSIQATTVHEFSAISNTPSIDFLLQASPSLKVDISAAIIDPSTKNWLESIQKVEGKSLFFNLDDFNDYEELPTVWVPYPIVVDGTEYSFYLRYNNLDSQYPHLKDKLLSFTSDVVQVEDILKEMKNSFHLKRQYYMDFRSRKSSQAAMASDDKVFSFTSKVIVTVFAGRKNRLELLMKYLKLALYLNIIQEIHLWDYCRNEEDRIHLLSYIHPEEGIYLKTRSSTRKFWTDFYEYYGQYGRTHPKDIILKCDDDITFIDLFRLPYFLDLIESRGGGGEDDDNVPGVLFANIINNGVAAYYQQQLLNILPKSLDDYEYPVEGMCGTLWESAEKAKKLHDYFLSNWESIIRPSSNTSNTIEVGLDGVSMNTSLPTEEENVYYLPELLPIESRFSINFFGMVGRHWSRLKAAGYDDEFDITVGLVKYNVLKNFLATNFFVSHLSFMPQTPGIEETDLLERYHVLYEEYVRKYFNTFAKE
jgi:hypothetical protein